MITNSRWAEERFLVNVFFVSDIVFASDIRNDTSAIRGRQMKERPGDNREYYRPNYAFSLIPSWQRRNVINYQLRGIISTSTCVRCAGSGMGASRPHATTYTPLYSFLVASAHLYVCSWTMSHKRKTFRPPGLTMHRSMLCQNRILTSLTSPLVIHMHNTFGRRRGAHSHHRWVSHSHILGSNACHTWDNLTKDECYRRDGHLWMCSVYQPFRSGLGSIIIIHNIIRTQQPISYIMWLNAWHDAAAKTKLAIPFARSLCRQHYNILSNIMKPVLLSTTLMNISWGKKSWTYEYLSNIKTKLWVVSCWWWLNWRGEAYNRATMRNVQEWENEHSVGICRGTHWKHIRSSSIYIQNSDEKFDEPWKKGIILMPAAVSSAVLEYMWVD